MLLVRSNMWESTWSPSRKGGKGVHSWPERLMTGKKRKRLSPLSKMSQGVDDEPIMGPDLVNGPNPWLPAYGFQIQHQIHASLQSAHEDLRANGSLRFVVFSPVLFFIVSLLFFPLFRSPSFFIFFSKITNDTTSFLMKLIVLALINNNNGVFWCRQIEFNKLWSRD